MIRAGASSLARRALAPRALGVAVALALASCSKVPIHDVAAGFTLADASWFAEEETLFVFYDVSAEQGLGDQSVLEIAYVTDDETVDWTSLTDLPAVHTHVALDCGTTRRCGSWSLHVPKEPRDVALRLRYHRDGEMALDADTVFNVVGTGDAWSHRSYLAYGVFDATNRRVQWRGRHRFPTLRNEQASDYGLRRSLVVADAVYGTADLASSANLYGYGVDCPGAFVPAGLSEVETDERAAFAEGELPLDASEATTVCALATVTDAKGTFTTGAIARKNPEVRPAFPELRSPIREAKVLPFFLEPCDRRISAEHEEMQRQRLLVGALPSTCIDDWDAPGFADALAATFSDAIERARPEGRDMVLVVGLHQDEDGASEAVQEALAQVVPEERLKTSPRLAGAFVFDSDGDGPSIPELDTSTLWCPATISQTDTDVTLANLTCAIAPDNPSVELGPFSFGTLPILPSREQYLEFVDTYSEAQAGEVTGMSLRTPEFATTAEHVPLGDYGVATFLNDEAVSAEADDAFSYCATDDPAVIVFRSAFMESEAFQALLAQNCESGGLPEDLCSYGALGLLPLALLPSWHAAFPEASYALGLFWDFPFLLHLDFETSAAGSVTAFGFSVPFGIAANGESYLGTAMWTTDTFSLAETLTQCTRFCDHATFDSAGVYQVAAPFRTAYATSCYLPDYPEPGDGGFPLDP